MARREPVRSAMRAEDGVALITVIGVMLVITILAIGSFALARQTLFDARSTADETRAFRAASAGIDTVISDFRPSVTVPSQTLATPDGSATVTVARTGGDAGEYEIVSVGTGLDGSKETLVQRFFYINLWEMNFAGTGSQSLMSGSSGMNGSSNIYGPFYIKGSLAVEANMSVKEGPLFVKNGKLSTKSGASEIGAVDRKVAVYCDGGTDLTKGTVHITGPYLSVPEITLPKIKDSDMSAYAVRAQSESIDGKLSREGVSTASLLDNMEMTSRGGAIYKYFGDTTSTIDALGAGNTPLVLGGAGSSVAITGLGSFPGRGTFGSWGAVDTTGAVIPAGGSAPYNAAHRNRWDDFAYWDEFTGEWDLLFISGTVFVDGPLVINDDVMYIGNGTIVVNGPVTLNGRVRPYSYSTAAVVVNKVGEDKKWALGIVTPRSITMKGSSSNSNVQPIRDNAFDYAGAFYTDDTIFVPQPNTSLRGSILSNKMEFSSPNTDLVTNPLLPTYLPDSLPGGGQGILTPGNWSRM